MLRVATFIANSTIPGAGVGLFAAQPIKKGAVIWSFDRGFDLVVDLNHLPNDPEDIFLKALIKYGYRMDNGDGRGSYCYCSDDARFINHSYTPNLFDELVFNTSGRTLAARDIGAGEELFCDYDLMAPFDPVTGWKPGDGYRMGDRAEAFLAGRMTRAEFISVASRPASEANGVSNGHAAHGQAG